MDILWSVLGELLTPQKGWSIQLVLRILLSTAMLFVYIVVLARTFGSRTFASLTSYDFLTNIAAGSLVASAILGPSIVESALSLLVLVLLQWLVSGLSARSTAAQKALDNRPVVLVENGVLQQEAMNHARVSQAVLEMGMRAQGVTDLREVRFAVLESGGTISIVKAS